MNGRRALSAILLALCWTGAAAAPKAELWARWAAHDEANTATIDHRAWQQFLDRHVRAAADGIHRVAYGRAGEADKAALAGYLQQLQALPISAYARDEQRAYWINLYNAATVKVVLDHYPVKSILDIGISPGLFVRGPWGKKGLMVENQALSLDDIEHRILRPIWKDPRTHYAVNCASIGCPNLALQAYRRDQLDAQLEDAARAYVNHPRGARVSDGRLQVSSIYEWFKTDFGGDDAGVIAHLRRYAAPALAAQLKPIDRIGDDAYDWGINALAASASTQ